MSCNNCPICLFELQDDEIKYTTSCNHTYHLMCVNILIHSKCTAKNKCPTCRATLDISKINNLVKNLSNDTVVSNIEDIYKLRGVHRHNGTILFNLETDGWFIGFKHYMTLINLERRMMYGPSGIQVSCIKLDDANTRVCFQTGDCKYFFNKNVPSIYGQKHV